MSPSVRRHRRLPVLRNVQLVLHPPTHLRRQLELVRAHLFAPHLAKLLRLVQLEVLAALETGHHLLDLEKIPLEVVLDDALLDLVLVPRKIVRANFLH